MVFHIAKHIGDTVYQWWGIESHWGKAKIFCQLKINAVAFNVKKLIENYYTIPYASINKLQKWAIYVIFNPNKYLHSYRLSIIYFRFTYYFERDNHYTTMLFTFLSYKWIRCYFYDISITCQKKVRLLTINPSLFPDISL